MEASISLKSYPRIGFDGTGKKPISGLRFVKNESSIQKLTLPDVSKRRGVSMQSRPVGWKICCSHEKTAAHVLQSETSYTSTDEALILKKKSQEVLSHLNGRCIYLVGMMGSGKTTVGKILSEALGYSFFDSDKLVEQAVGGTSVAQIFKQYSEAFFRDNESEVLRDLSLMCRLVVATGGGAVIRPVNWRYMKQGISVWLDVPLDALARRIAAVGTDSRPLLHEESGDAYTKAFMRLTTLFGEREDAYANADVTVSLQYIAAKQGHEDVGAITPTAIAVEALVQIQNFLRKEAHGEYL